MSIDIIKEILPSLNNITPSRASSCGCSFKYTSDIDTENVFVKLSFNPKKNTHNNQRVEAQIYKHILKKLQKNTPHLPIFYKSIETNFDFKKSKLDISTWEDGIDFWDTDKANILVIENVGAKTLSDIEEDPLIIFQVLFTIACFESVGLKHNDLHLGNIIVKELDKAVYLCYKIDDEIISFKTKKIVKIIDYDRSCIYSSKVERNRYLDLLYKEESINQYNGVNNGFDTFKFLSNYKHSNSEIKNWMRLVCPQIFFVKYENDLLPQYIDAKNLIGDTKSLLLSLVENFPDSFSNKRKNVTVYEIPENRSIQPIHDDTKFPIYKSLRNQKAKGYDYIYKELLLLGYNWQLHHNKLYSDIQTVLDIPEKQQNMLYEACMWITNPIKISEPNDMVNMIIKEFDPILHIPQRSFKIIEKISWYHKVYSE